MLLLVVSAMSVQAGPQKLSESCFYVSEAIGQNDVLFQGQGLDDSLFTALRLSLSRVELTVSSSEANAEVTIARKASGVWSVLQMFATDSIAIPAIGSTQLTVSSFPAELDCRINRMYIACVPLCP